MRVIKDNTRDEATLTRCICSCCGSVLEVTEEDFIRGEANEEEGHKFIKCPCCGNVARVIEYIR